MREHTPEEANLAIKVELVNHSSQEFGTWNKKGSMCGHWIFKYPFASESCSTQSFFP